MRAAPFEAERNAVDRLVDELAGRRAQRETRRVWAAVMLAVHVDVCESIVRGRPVLVRQLDPVALRRALRGGPLPATDSYLRLRAGHLDAVAEGGPFR